MIIFSRFHTAPEHRLLMRGVFGNVANVAEGAWGENVGEPIKRGNYAKAAMGIPIAIADNILTAPDAALAGLVGDDIEPLKAQSFARTTRDVRRITRHGLDTLGNLLTLKPWEATKSLVKGGVAVVGLGGDVPMDIINDATGVSVVERRQAQYHDQILALAA